MASWRWARNGEARGRGIGRVGVMDHIALLSSKLEGDKMTAARFLSKGKRPLRRQGPEIEKATQRSGILKFGKGGLSSQDGPPASPCFSPVHDMFIKQHELHAASHSFCVRPNRHYWSVATPDRSFA